jgi:fucose permease
MREAGEFVEKRDKSEEKETNIKEILSNKAVHFLALFILIYVGVEVTIGGWIVTYIIEERGGGPSAGYISSGFFGGKSRLKAFGQM